MLYITLSLSLSRTTPYDCPPTLHPSQLLAAKHLSMRAEGVAASLERQLHASVAMVRRYAPAELGMCVYVCVLVCMPAGVGWWVACVSLTIPLNKHPHYTLSHVYTTLHHMFTFACLHHTTGQDSIVLHTDLSFNADVQPSAALREAIRSDTRMHTYEKQ
jgi:hypothetical protein